MIETYPTEELRVYNTCNTLLTKNYAGSSYPLL